MVNLSKVAAPTLNNKYWAIKYPKNNLELTKIENLEWAVKLVFLNAFLDKVDYANFSAFC